jgi:hypothetical protein
VLYEPWHHPAESRPCQFHLSIAQWRDTPYCHSTVGNWESQGKKWVRLCACRTFQPKHQSSLRAPANCGTHRDCVHTSHMSFDCWCTPTTGSMPCLWRIWRPKCPLLQGQESLKTSCSTIPA